MNKQQPRRRIRGLYAPELLESRIAPATFTVTTLAGDDSAGSLREAVAMANDPVAHPGPDTIVFNLMNPTVPHTINLNTGGLMDIVISDSLTIQGPGVDLLTITGDNAIRIFNINDPAGLATATISGLSLIDGKASGGGGAIYSTESLVLKNVVIASSEASGKGGGVCVVTPVGNPVDPVKVSIDSCRIVGNEAKGSGDGGGGLYLAAAGGISVVKSIIAKNKAEKAGGLYAGVPTGPATIILDKLIVSDNSATMSNGGGLSLDGKDSGVPNAIDAQIVVKNCLITGNSAVGKGGGLYLDDGKLILSKTTFSGNTAARGGALANEAAGAMDISGSRFLANKATSNAQQGGGALYMQGPTAGTSTVKITGTLFSGNSSATIGGAITTSTVGDIVTLDIKGCSFLGNTSATEGGALFLANKTALTLKGSVLSGNVAGGAGGAIHAISDSSITASGNKFTENAATGKGGAIHANGSVVLNLMGNLFSANVGSRGGALYAGTDAMITMKGDKVLGNTATGGDGGGLYFDTTNTVILTGLLVQGNRAAGSGGGITLNVSNANPATITGCKILDNVADYESGEGGGIFVFAGKVNILKSTVTGNVASNGGGISDSANTYLDAATAAKTVRNSARTNPNTDGTALLP